MFPKPTRKRDKKLRTSYHTDMTCLLCTNAATPAHIKGFGAFGDDTKDNMAPLCGVHHTIQGQMGMTTFASKHPAFKEWLIDKGWILDEFLQKWRKY